MHAAQHGYTSHIHASSGHLDKHACSSALLHEPHTCKQCADRQACLQLGIATRATCIHAVGRWTSIHAAQHCYTSHIYASSGQIYNHACSSAMLHEPHKGDGQKSVDGAPYVGYHIFIRGPGGPLCTWCPTWYPALHLGPHRTVWCPAPGLGAQQYSMTPFK
jgi:hypothetical protein